MKTVGDFWKGGLIFVGRDLIRVCNDRVIPVGHRDLGVYIDCFVDEFAWRTNTGLTPAFAGLVDAVHGDVTISGAKIDDLNWGSDTSIDKWRPHLPIAEAKPELFWRANSFPAFEAFEAPDEAGFVAKPVYTKEMHEAGELPPVGADVEICSAKDLLIPECQDGDNVECICHSTGSGGSPIGVFRHSCGVSISLADWTYRPIKTDREKAIEEVTGEWPMADKSTIEVMFDLGYRKEQVK